MDHGIRVKVRQNRSVKERAAGAQYAFEFPMNISAFILAGGKSSRMGRDKALLPFGGRTLLDRVQELASTVTNDVRIVGPRNKYGLQAIEDVYPDRGPLGGIHAALAASHAELNLMLSVDTPFVEPVFLRWMLDEAARTGTTVTVPYVGGRFQPLCAVYRREFLALAEPALRAGKNKIDPLFCHTTVRRIEDEELKRLAFDARMFDNLNTPEDLARAQNRR